MTKNLISALAFLLPAAAMAVQKPYSISSPDGNISVEVTVDGQVSYSLYHDGDLLLDESSISMTLDDGTVYGLDSGRPVCRTVSGDRTIESPFYKKSEIRDRYNEMSLEFRKFILRFRVYDEGMAYRFISKSGVPFKVVSEEAVFSFPEDSYSYVPYVKKPAGESFESQFYNSFENTYSHVRLSEWDSRRLAFMPVAVEAAGGRTLCITEADLLDYPGMYLNNPDGGTSLRGVFAPVPDEVIQGGHNMLQGVVRSRKPYIAECAPGEVFPWRVIAVSEEDRELADNDMVYKLATPADGNMDFSWVKPGKVAWEWWNDWNLYGVDFKTGVNNETYMHYIDFAAENGIGYVILDEGWAVRGKADLMQVVPEIDLEMLVNYAGRKNVGIILWAGYWAFNKDMEGVCRHFSEMGIKGFKIDFMNRDDQQMVRFHRQAAETAAKYRLMVDFHGTYKPVGLNRTWPNVVNYEGVHGLEQMKWSSPETDQVTYDVTIPFIRMLAGPMDYTQGAMRNATRGNYRPVNSEPMSQGTRCRQLAEYIVFESPLNMLCDSPSSYAGEPECLGFISQVPETWDNTVSLDGKIAEYVVMARCKDDTWYVGGMTGWTEKTVSLDLSFLGEGDYVMEIFRDGENADRAARDYRKDVIPVSSASVVPVKMAPGGGFAARISKLNTTK